MTRRALVAAVSVLLATGCQEPAQHNESPAWLEALKAQIVAEPLGQPPELLFRYRYRGEVVYYRPPRCCDVFGELYDAGGELLCHPDGGFTGRGDGRCEDFAAARSDCVRVWHDPRSKGSAIRACPNDTADANPEY